MTFCRYFHSLFSSSSPQGDVRESLTSNLTATPSALLSETPPPAINDDMSQILRGDFIETFQSSQASQSQASQCSQSITEPPTKRRKFVAEEQFAVLELKLEKQQVEISELKNLLAVQQHQMVEMNAILQLVLTRLPAPTQPQNSSSTPFPFSENGLEISQTPSQNRELTELDSSSL